MTRFVAVAWSHFDKTTEHVGVALSDEISASKKLNCVYLGRNLRVLRASGTVSDRIIPISGRGVILGQLFLSACSDGQSGVPASWSEDASDSLVASGGSNLIKGYWGNYVAIWRDQNCVRILRDPSGAVGCCYQRAGKIHLLFSHLEDVCSLDSALRGARFNWSFIRQRCVLGRTHTRSTGILNVSEILPGERLTLSELAVTTDKVWSVLQFASDEFRAPPDKAEAALRSVVTSCVGAWANSLPKLLHMLSGGLDSSLVLACLRMHRAAETICTLTYYSKGSDTDERSYARIMASSVGCGLDEVLRDDRLRLDTLLSMRPTESPLDYLYSLTGRLIEPQAAAAHGCQVITTGAGGDQLFGMNYGMAAQDFARRQGFSKEFFRIAWHTARATRSTLWQVVWRAVKDRRLKRPVYTQPWTGGNSSLLHEDVVKDVESYPCNDDMEFAPELWRHLSEGKYRHAYELRFHPQPYNSLAGRDHPLTITPLYSQPIMECVLGIPTHRLVDHGWDRIMIRRGFEHEMPDAIVRRSAKGGVEEHSSAILARNLPFVRELLLDGQLAQEGVLNRSALERFFDKDQSISWNPTDIHAYVACECWLSVCGGQLLLSD